MVRTGSGAQLIAAERERQVVEEGYTAEHDAGHAEELILAAAAYIVNLTNSSDGVIVDPHEFWPWAGRFWKPTEDVRRDLVKAGALIAAAIDAWPEDRP
ncbi:MAG: hypothetical protein KF809_14975 [Chloroflexi bacterium]|nr:hypothetical protein [Chloroflexota bacterium]